MWTWSAGVTVERRGDREPCPRTHRQDLPCPVLLESSLCFSSPDSGILEISEGEYSNHLETICLVERPKKSCMPWGHMRISQIEAQNAGILSESSDLTNLLNEFRTGIFSLDLHNERAMLVSILSLIPSSIYWCLLCTRCWV